MLNNILNNFLKKINVIKPTVGSLCSGIGGFDLAFKNVGYELKWAVDFDKYAFQTYLANFNTPCFLYDISKIDINVLEKVDVITAGFPCQPFSIAGTRQGFNDMRGTVIFDILKIVDELQPKVVLLENVKGLVNHSKGKTLSYIIDEFIKIGYNAKYQVLNSKDFGLPQNRERLYIICSKLDRVSPNFPKTTNKLTVVKDILEDNVDDKYFISNKLKQFFIRKLEKSSFHPTIITEDTNSTRTLTSRYYKDGAEILLNTKPNKIGYIKNDSQGQRVYGVNSTSVTLKALGGGLGAKTGLYEVENNIRRLTPRECARLQGFPEDFKIVCSDTQAYKQFGNAVSISVIEAIAKEIKKVI